jgi:DNA-binding response OmpR family regulator
MNEGPSVLLVSDDDDVAQPLVVALLRAGYRVGQAGSREAPDDLDGALPDVLIVDRDLPAEARRQLGERLTRHAGRNAFPLILIGDTVSKERDFVPADWHEDAVIVLPRPAHPGEVVTAVRAILRLSFYRTYRDLVHDLSQPVTVLHALSGALARDIPAGAPHHDRVMLLHDEVERMLSLMERFQRSRADRDR